MKHDIQAFSQETFIVSDQPYCVSSSNILLTLLFFLILLTPVTADLEVHFLDVNEGDAIFLESDGQTMLIDAGTADSGNLTKHYLNSLGITGLDMVLVTSPEEGRTGGMTNILNATPARIYYDGGWILPEGSYNDIITKLDVDQIPRKTVSAGSTITFAEGVNITMLNPVNGTSKTREDTLIPLITYGSTKFLLMGYQQEVSDNVSAQIMRVADHGSRQGTDPGFTMNVHPEIAIISCGVNNPSGNPVATTLNILQSTGAEVMRTDTDGTIIINTDGTRYSVGKLRMEPDITLSLVSVVETRTPT